MVAALPLLREVIIREGITILHGHGVRGGGMNGGGGGEGVRDGKWRGKGGKGSDSMCMCVCVLLLAGLTRFFMKQKLIINDHVTSIN